jgi:hypothetical protein
MFWVLAMHFVPVPPIVAKMTLVPDFTEVCTMPCHGVVVEDDNHHPLGRGDGACHGM